MPLQRTAENAKADSSLSLRIWRASITGIQLARRDGHLPDVYDSSEIVVSFELGTDTAFLI